MRKYNVKKGDNMFAGKKVLITGSHGLIGKELYALLYKLGAKITTADKMMGQDLTDWDTCMRLCKGKDYVFNLVGIKGNPKMTAERPIDFMEPMLKFDTNMITAAQKCKVKRFLYTSSIAVLNPETDKFPAHAKMTGELLCQAEMIQSPEGTQYCIVRPANVYGRFDDFGNKNLMVISNLIKKALEDPDLLEVWGDGTQERDFVYAKDVAEGMILAMEKMPKEAINLCSGTSNTIKEIVDIISHYTGVKEVFYDLTKPTGDKRRVMPTNGELIGWKANTPIAEGLRETIIWKKKYWRTLIV